MIAVNSNNFSVSQTRFARKPLSADSGVKLPFVAFPLLSSPLISSPLLSSPLLSVILSERLILNGLTGLSQVEFVISEKVNLI